MCGYYFSPAALSMAMLQLMVHYSMLWTAATTYDDARRASVHGTMLVPVMLTLGDPTRGGRVLEHVAGVQSARRLTAPTTAQQRMSLMAAHRWRVASMAWFEAARWREPGA